MKPGVDITILYGDEFEGRTVLHDAPPKGHVDVIRYLLAHGEPDDGHDEIQYGISTPLFYALRSARIDAVRTLLNVGPNVNIVGPNGDNVLSVVLQGGRGVQVKQKHVDTITLLVDRGLDINRRANEFGGTLVSLKTV